MPHSADNSFFDSKRSWSKRKDLILGYYLTPYLPKIATQKRPVFIVDGFAGPGKFRDGDLGSPLIMASHIEAAMNSGLTVPARMLAIEADVSLHGDLTNNLSRFSFAETRNVKFIDAIDEIRNRAQQHNVFLYIDPYAIEGLDWAALDTVFQMLDSGVSIEFLLNFNVQAFARRGRSALQINQPVGRMESGVEEELDRSDQSNRVQADRLDAVVGGDWWREILMRRMDFPSELAVLTEGLCEKLRGRFREVFTHEVKASESHTVPKYVLVFASRSNHAIPLINDAAVRSLEMYASDHEPDEPMLFETRPVSLVPDTAEIYAAIRRVAPSEQAAITRRDLAIRVIREIPGRHTDSAIKKVIGKMIDAGQLASATGKSRINDRVTVWRI